MHSEGNSKGFYELFEDYCHPTNDGYILDSCQISSVIIDTAENAVHIEASFAAKVSDDFLHSLENGLCKTYNLSRVSIQAQYTDCPHEEPCQDESDTDTQTAQNRPAKKTSKKGKAQDDGLPFIKTSAKTLYGKSISNSFTPLCQITIESGRSTVFGEVFGLETRTTKDGSKYIITFFISDLTGSLSIKLIAPKQKCKLLLDEVRNGACVLVRGDVGYDKYDRDIAMRAEDISLVEKKQRTDDAPEKRVELHLHTNMSAMDGVSPVSDIIKRAAAYGHKAIAITDHGVAQAFPDAMKAGAKAGIKIIYGLEAYLVSDTYQVTYGYCNEPFNGDFVVFDVETTGLNPLTASIIEIGAVRISGGEIVDSFDTLVNPNMPIPPQITELTGITDEMVQQAPAIDEALKKFKDFCGEFPLVAHNVSFDLSFIRAAAKKTGITFENAGIDTLPIAQGLFPKLSSHRLTSVAQHLKLGTFNAHRAGDDAAVTARAFIAMLREVESRYQIDNIALLNHLFYNGCDIKKSKTSHLILLVKNKTGLKNLYKLISKAHIDYFHYHPRIPKSLLMEYREGILIGSACESGELYRAVLEGKPEDELLELGAFYDYLEIQPVGNNAFLVRDGILNSLEEIKEHNKRIYNLGKALGKPVVATGDVHFVNPEDSVFRAVLMAGQGFNDADNQAPLYYRTTDEMLAEFEYLGQETANEVVIKNPVHIAKLCEDIRPVPKENFPPEMPGAQEELITLVNSRARELYGDPLPDIVRSRLDRELESIIKHGFAIMYMIAQKLVAKSLSDGYMVGSRGSVGSSVVAFLSGITEVNALAPHYRCTACKYSEFITDSAYDCGADMPDKLCPNCGTVMKKDGFNIPFETFLGFDGDKAPDIDLNFSGEYQPVAHKYIETLFGEGYVFRAGTIGTLADKTAFGFVKKYLEDRGKVVTKAEEARLIAGCVGVKRTTGQHPGGVMIVPKTKDIYDFCPIQRPADSQDTNIITTHFDYHSIHDNLLKLDILGHDDPTTIRMLEDLTGFSAKEVPLDDPATMSIFSGNDALGLSDTSGMLWDVGTVAIPEFGTKFVRQMLIDTRPKTFAELVRISGLSHGTDVWTNNAQELIRNKIATLKEVICTRDDIMLYLLKKGLPPLDSFSIMESVRKGKGLKPEQESLMAEHEVPSWYIDSCKKIKYMFPKAHAVAYVTMAFRIAYFKVHYPEAFYATYFTVKSTDFDAAKMIYGPEIVMKSMREIESNPQATSKEKSMLTVLEVCLEMYRRGFKFLPVDLKKSDATKFLLTPDGILPPFSSLQGLGVSAAHSIVEARGSCNFISVEEFQQKCGVSRAVIEILENCNVLGNLPKTTQLSFFNK